MKLTIKPGQQLLVAGKWKLEGETVEVADEYEAKVLLASDVAEPVSEPEAPATKGSK